MNLTRYINVIKYLLLRSRDKAEPEDQDYYGAGSRSARWCIVMILGMMFCQIQPLLPLVCLINFAICKLVYSYLLVFAETRKPDLGGVIWVNQLHHLQFGLFLFFGLMMGKLSMSCRSWFPVIIAGTSGFLLMWCYQRFKGIEWERLPFSVEPLEHTLGEEEDGVYIQTEMLQSQ